MSAFNPSSDFDLYYKACRKGDREAKAVAVNRSPVADLAAGRMDETSVVALELKTGVPAYQVEDVEARTHFLIHLPIEEQNEHRWCLWCLVTNCFLVTAFCLPRTRIQDSEVHM